MFARSISFQFIHLFIGLSNFPIQLVNFGQIILKCSTTCTSFHFHELQLLPFLVYPIVHVDCMPNMSFSYCLLTSKFSRCAIETARACLLIKSHPMAPYYYSNRVQTNSLTGPSMRSRVRTCHPKSAPMITHSCLHCSARSLHKRCILKRFLGQF